MHDFGTILKAYGREILPEIKLYGELHRLIPALASRSGADRGGADQEHLSQEWQVELWDRPHQTAPSGSSHVKFLLDCSTRPLQFFSVYGLLAAAAGLFVSFVLLKKLLFQEAIMVEHGPLLLLGIAMIVSGIQLISLGLLG